jgi:hypothetical protein
MQSLEEYLKTVETTPAVKKLAPISPQEILLEEQREQQQQQQRLSQTVSNQLNPIATDIFLSHPSMHIDSQ